MYSDAFWVVKMSKLMFEMRSSWRWYAPVNTPSDETPSTAWNVVNIGRFILTEFMNTMKVHHGSKMIKTENPKKPWTKWTSVNQSHLWAGWWQTGRSPWGSRRPCNAWVHKIATYRRFATQNLKQTCKTTGYMCNDATLYNMGMESFAESSDTIWE